MSPARRPALEDAIAAERAALRRRNIAYLERLSGHASREHEAQRESDLEERRLDEKRGITPPWWSDE